jgi:LysM repeat protein
MIKRYALVLIILSAVLVYLPAYAEEESAQTTPKETAAPQKNFYTYKVKKGDLLSVIVRHIPGITEKDTSNNYELIKKLNPHIPNLNKLEAGQTLILPGKPMMEPEGKTEAKTKLTEAKEKEIKSKKTFTTGTKSTHKIPSAKARYYKIKKGDGLMEIIRRELKVAEADIPQAIKIIKSLNPRIKNVNKIHPGTVIKLPGRTALAQTTAKTKADEQKVTETTTQAGKAAEVKEKKVMPPEVGFAVLKQIITQMNGSINTTGNYYLPFSKTGQVTIDCSKIPVIEFDDNTTIFLDLENRANNNLKKMISDNWANYYLVKTDNNDDVITILKKVVNATKNYSMIKSEKPLIIGAYPPVEVTVDWVIFSTLPKKTKALKQGLRMINEGNLLLPKAIKNYSQKNGLIITEISPETGLVGKMDDVYSLPSVPVFPTTSARDFSYALVTTLGLNAEKDVDIQIFDTVKDGFNLSIKADVLVKNEDKKYIIYSQSLSPQFVNALKQAGNEIILVTDNDSPESMMENILHSLNISFTSRNFMFSGLEKKQAPYALNFNGTKIKTDKDLYVIDFDFDQELRGLMQEVWSANIAKY